MKIARRVALCLILLVTAAAGGTVAWAATHGYRVYIVHTGSMVPTLRYGDIVVDRPAQLPVHKGEIITFRYNSGPDSVITHRAVSDKAGKIRTKGDANPTRDPWTIYSNQVVGTPMAIVPGVGYVLYYLKQPAGAASVATVALGIWLLWDLCFGTTPDEAPEEAGAESAEDRPGAGAHASGWSLRRHKRAGSPAHRLAVAAASRQYRLLVLSLICALVAALGVLVATTSGRNGWFFVSVAALLLMVTSASTWLGSRKRPGTAQVTEDSEAIERAPVEESLVAEPFRDETAHGHAQDEEPGTAQESEDSDATEPAPVEEPVVAEALCAETETPHDRVPEETEETSASSSPSREPVEVGVGR